MTRPCPLYNLHAINCVYHLQSLDGKHTLFGEVAEDDEEVVAKINAAIVDDGGRPLQNIRIRRTEVRSSIMRHLILCCCIVLLVLRRVDASYTIRGCTACVQLCTVACLTICTIPASALHRGANWRLVGASAGKFVLHF